MIYKSQMTNLDKERLEDAKKYLQDALDWSSKQEFTVDDRTYTGESAIAYKCGAMSACVEFALMRLNAITIKEDESE